MAALVKMEEKGGGALPLPLCDIGVNIADDMYSGQYHGKKHHEPDIGAVLSRALKAGVRSIICTSTTLEECVSNIMFVRNYRKAEEDEERKAPADTETVPETSDETACSSGNRRCTTHASMGVYATAGIHPTRCGVFETDGDVTIEQLEKCIQDGMSDGSVVAFGEFGLDYDRLHFCSEELQKLGFERQLDLAAKYKLPLFLHNRNTHGDFARIMASRGAQLAMCGGGVVHSFDGSEEELLELLDIDGLYIGINGCSLKTEENCRVASLVPVERLLLETDAPWCGVKPTHAGFKHVKTRLSAVKKEKYKPITAASTSLRQSMSIKDELLVKDRNEPCNMIQILEIMHALLGGDEVMSIAQLADIVYANSVRLFDLNDQSKNAAGLELSAAAVSS